MPIIADPTHIANCKMKATWAPGVHQEIALAPVGPFVQRERNPVIQEASPPFAHKEGLCEARGPENLKYFLKNKCIARTQRHLRGTNHPLKRNRPKKRENRPKRELRYNWRVRMVEKGKRRDKIRMVGSRKRHHDCIRCIVHLI